MPRVLLDFTAADGPATRVALEDPVRVVTAASIDAVIPALVEVQRAVEGGLTAAGFIAYEAAPAFESRMRVRAGGRLPLLWFGLFDGPGTPLEGMAEGPADALRWEIETDRAEHAAAVRRIHEHIAAGRTYQVNLTTRLRAELTADPLHLWHRMRRAQGPGYHAFIDPGTFAIASASPELFFRTRGRQIETRPMKGTRPRGRWPAEDLALRDDLGASAKDRAENLMIVDLLRNDLGRVADTGTVRVPRLFEVERYRTVWQMTSTVTATLRPGATLTDILAALFPCGSVTGAPKISTMEVIAELERSPREVYCGAIGIIRPDGDATFSVPIRTAWVDRERGEAEYGTGGGVVWDSTADGEYDELMAKAVVVRAPWPSFRLLETLRLEDGALRRADRHVARLRASAEHFGFPFPGDAVLAALDDARRAHGSGIHRLRLLVAEDGEVETRVEPLAGPVGSDQVPHAAADAPQAAAVPVALAASPVSSLDRFLYHKTTRRDVYDAALEAAPPGAWDVLLVNERGELTELTRGNLVLALDGELLTPPLDAGLLPGCLRAELLDSGMVREAVIVPADLAQARGLWLVNSLRGWVPLAL